MKQHTTPDQTAKLIELGFPHPRVDAGVTKWEGYEPICTGSYTLGELIEMLPKSLKNPYNPPLAIECNEKWRVYYGTPEEYSWEWSIWYEEENNELIDALYDMCIILKKKKVI